MDVTGTREIGALEGVSCFGSCIPDKETEAFYGPGLGRLMKKSATKNDQSASQG